VTLTSILLLGFLLGMRHALEADHLAAVATLATTSASLTNTVRQGVAWGAGHTLTLLLFGGFVILLGKEIPQSAAQSLEGIVGGMLILLGGHTLFRLGRDRVHMHRHRHTDGTDHFHAHSHGQDRRLRPADRHEHGHARRLPTRAVIVGMVHGLAGTAALVLLSVQAIQSAWAIVYIGLFGCGSILGMALLSAVIAMPLRLSARYLDRAHAVFTGVIGLSTALLGVLMIYRIGVGSSLAHG
jgi:High-affinity nickel-transport protein